MKASSPLVIASVSTSQVREEGVYHERLSIFAVAPAKARKTTIRATDFRRELQGWYDASRRALPWRETSDPYAIWVSEIMLQQTRVAAVIPYYHRFLERFPTVRELARAHEADLLSAWSGLGYYTRVRNMWKAARQMNGEFPRDYNGIRALAGVGDYTAAAVASIAFGLPHAVVDGNVQRVLARLTNDDTDLSSAAMKRRLQSVATELLDLGSPGRFNQALMELGATVCTPKQPRCLTCPVAAHCAAAAAGTQSEVPVKLKRTQVVRSVRTLLIVCKNGTFLVWQRPDDAKILAGMWELPEPDHLINASLGELLGSFKHSITNHEYTFRVVRGEVSELPEDAPCRWVSVEELKTLPLSTTTRKAFKLPLFQIENLEL